jgi:hypothetical protein
MEPNLDPALTPHEASVYLREKYQFTRSPHTLANLRSSGDRGPQFVKVGRWVRYRQSALDRYATDLISAPMRSTKVKNAAPADAT